METKCKHEKCHCKGDHLESEGFCSPACRESSVGAESGCNCGHPDCG